MSKMTDNHIAEDGKKVEEVIKAMKEVLTNPCSEQAYINETRDALDLINRQQKQLDNYSHNVRNMAKDFIDQQKIIQEQQAEIKELKKEKYRLQKALNQAEDYLDIAKAEIKWKTTYMHSLQLSMEEIKPQIKAEAIKEFADKLKADINKTWYYELENDTHNARALKRVDELVKEMVGEGK